MPNLTLYLRKIERRQRLAPEARAALLGVRVKLREIGANCDFVREGERVTQSCLLTSGVVSRYRSLPTGNRQILSFHVPGDMVDLQSSLIVISDHTIRTHSRTTLVTVDHSDILDLAAKHPSIAQAFWLDTLIDAAIFREWAVNLGRRNATERTAHLLLELAFRMRDADLVTTQGFPFPITQSDFADALGITAVHLNRVLQRLRGDGLIRTHMRWLRIEDEDALRVLAGFDATYLHREDPRPTTAT